MQNVYFISVFGRITSTAVSVLTSAVINRCLGPELKGEYAYLINWVNIFINILSFGMMQTSCTYRKKVGDYIFKKVLILTVAHSLIPFLMAVILAVFKIKIEIILFLMLIGSGTIRFNFNLIYGIYDIKKQSCLDILLKINLLFLTIIFLKKITGVNFLEKSYMVVFLGDMVTGLILMIVFLAVLHKEKPKTKIKLRKIYITGFLSMLLQVLGILNYNVDLIFLKKMMNSYDVGIYSVAMYVANMFWLITDALKDVIYSQSSKSEIGRELTFICKMTMLISFVLCLVYLVFGKFVIEFLYGTVYMKAYFISLILLTGHICMTFYKIIHPYYVSEGKQGMIVKVLSFSILINAMLNFFLIPVYGMIGAGVASGISYLFCSLYFLIHITKDFDIRLREFFLINSMDIKRIKRMIKGKSKRGKNYD